MEEESWAVYKKTKHRIGFRPPEGREFRLPRHLLPEAFAVGEAVGAAFEQRSQEAVLVVELGVEHPEVVQNVDPPPDPLTDRWIVWKRHEEWTGITGAPLSEGQMKTTGKFKLPPPLVPDDAGPGDQCLVLARVEDRTAQWMVKLNK